MTPADLLRLRSGSFAKLEVVRCLNATNQETFPIRLKTGTSLGAGLWT